VPAVRLSMIWMTSQIELDVRAPCALIAIVIPKAWMIPG
jgi:hypothetical protein